MGYYNDRRDYRGGGYPPRDYGDRRGGGGYGGYDDRRQGGYNDRFNNPTSKFDIGQKVVHIATGIELSVISYGREQLECRKPDLSTVWLYEHEIAPVSGPENK